MTEHSFHGIHFPPPQKGESVTYVSGTICYLCVGSFTLLFSTLRSFRALRFHAHFPYIRTIDAGSSKSAVLRGPLLPKRRVLFLHGHQRFDRSRMRALNVTRLPFPAT